MVRKPRVWYPGAIYHIMCRGNHRYEIFRDDEDHQVYLENLLWAKRNYNGSVLRSNNTYPCNFMMVGAMNPCPCGYYGHDRCRCTDNEILKYRQKISGPILDRIDIQKYVQPVEFCAFALPGEARVLQTSKAGWKGLELSRGSV